MIKGTGLDMFVTHCVIEQENYIISKFFMWNSNTPVAFLNVVLKLM